MFHNSNYQFAFSLVWIAVCFAGIVGWIANIVKIFNGDAEGALFVLRCLGVLVAPLGSVLGLFF